MEQPENRRKIERWLDLLDGGRAANSGWAQMIAGCVFLSFMVFAMIVEQERPGESFAGLAGLFISALWVLRGVASLLQERHETLATSLRLLCMTGWVAVFVILSISFYSSLGLLGAMIWLFLFIGITVLSIRKNRKQLQSEQPG